MAIWQWAFQYGVMSDVSCVNCPTLDQTYWFLSVGAWIFWALCFCGRMITFSSSHWYFIIIVLLLPSFLPNYYCQLPFWKAIMLWMPIISLLWNCPCARAPLDNKCYIHTVGSSFTFSLGAVPVYSESCFWGFVLHPLAMQWHFSLVCAAPSLPADILAAIRSCIHRIMIMFVTPCWGKHEDTSPSVFKCKWWVGKANLHFKRIPRFSSACGFIMAVYSMAATMCIMIPITEYTILKNLKGKNFRIYLIKMKRVEEREKCSL